MSLYLAIASIRSLNLHFLMKTYPCLRISLQSIFICLSLFALPCLLSAQLNVTVTATRTTCYAVPDGQATANPTGGTPPYTFSWSNGGTTQAIQNLAFGNYTVTVSDASLSTKSATGMVTQPNNIAASMPTTPQFCSLVPDGTAKCIPSGGTMPFTFVWSNGISAQQVNQLLAGTYTVTMTDSKGCTKQKSTQVEDATDEGLSTSVSATPTSCSYDVGEAYIWLMSGIPPFQYQWSNGDTIPFIENLAAGAYTVSVIDANGCSATDTVLVIDRGLMVENSMFSYTPCGYASGMATADPVDGTPPYQFQWSNGETTQTIDSLAGGIYTATVTDATGCSGTVSVYVFSDGNPSLTLLDGPKCLHQIATFTVDAPSLYPDLSWSLNDTLDQIISGQGTDSIAVQWASVGSKYVKVSFGINGTLCGGYGFNFNVVVCADAKEPLLEAASVSPNPFSDFVQIEFPAGTPADTEVVLTDVSGKIVLERSLSDAGEHLPTANLPAGIYFLKIKSGDGERIWKLLKQ